MTTKLDGTLKREIEVGEERYTLTLTATGLKLTEKGRRKGLEMSWKEMISGDAGIAAALQGSVASETES